MRIVNVHVVGVNFTVSPADPHHGISSEDCTCHLVANLEEDTSPLARTRNIQPTKSPSRFCQTDKYQAKSSDSEFTIILGSSTTNQSKWANCAINKVLGKRPRDATT